MGTFLQSGRNDDPEEVEEHEIYRRLKEGYNFTDARNAVLVQGDEEDQAEQAHYLSPEVAKQYILAGKGQYMTQDTLRKYKENNDWGGAAGMAAAVPLGIMDSLSFGMATELLGRAGLPAEAIKNANPGISLASDMLATGAAIALSGGWAAVPKLAGTAGAKALSKVGGKKLLHAASKAPWQYTPAGAIAKVGRGTESLIARKLLGEAAEETLEKAGSRGLLARIGAGGVEGLLYAGGYGMVEAASDLYDGRKPEEVAKTFAWDVGVGGLLGASLPMVFSGAGFIGAKGFQKGKEWTGRALKAAHETETMKTFNKYMAEGAGMLDPEKYGQLHKRNEFQNALDQRHLVEDAMKASRELVENQEGTILRVADHIDDASKLNSAIGDFDQGGHHEDFIMDALTAVPRGGNGAASTAVLAEQLVNGNDVFRKQFHQQVIEQTEQASDGLLDVLINHTYRMIAEGTKTLGIDDVYLPPKLRQKLAVEGFWDKKSKIPEEQLKVLPVAMKELNRILSVLDHLKEISHSKIDDIAARVKNKKVRKGLIRQIEAVETKTGDQLYKDLSRVLIGDETSFKDLDATFNGLIFQELEALSSRMHLNIRKGPFADTEYYQDYMNVVKKEITEFLTNAGAWESDAAQTAFGKMALEKANTNTVFKVRGDIHAAMRDNFFEGDPAFPDNYRPDLGKIEKWIKTLDHYSSKSKLDSLLEYVDANHSVLTRLRDAYQPYRAPGTKVKKVPWLDKDYLGEEGPKEMAIHLSKWIRKAEQSKKDINKYAGFLQFEMTPALQYAALLQRERMVQATTTNPSLMPYAFGLGLGGLFGGPMGMAAGGAAAGAWRGAQDLMLNPGSALAKMHTFFVTVNQANKFADDQLSRYFRWLNYSKVKGGKMLAPGVSGPTDLRRVTYEGPGNKIRFPQLLTSNVVARMIAGGDFEEKNSPAKKVSEENTKNLGVTFGGKDIARARTINEALEKRKEEIKAEVSAGFSFDPNLQQAVGLEVDSYIANNKKALDTIDMPELSPLDDPRTSYIPSDFEAEQVAQYLAINERGEGMIIRDFMNGTLTQNQWDWFLSTQTEAAMRFIQKIQNHMAEPGARENLPQKEKDLLGMILGVDVVPNSIAAVLQENYVSEDEGKPGPKPSPGVQLPGMTQTGTMGVESRRTT